MRSHQTEQGITQIYSLMTSLRAEGVPRKLALITLTWAQLLAGTQQPVLSNVTTTLPHLASMKWIPSICKFLHCVGGSMEVKNLPTTPLQHEHDRFLMDIALDLYSKPSNLQHLNTCRLHLQVTLLSDITTADGKFIRSEVMQSHRPLSNSANELFRYQSSPDTAGWNLWHAFLIHLTRSPTHSLIQPLRRWLHSSHALIRKWQSYIDLSTDIVYFRKQDTFEVYETLPTTPQYEYICITVSPPPPPPPPPPPFLLISTSLDDRSLDPVPHCLSRLPQCHRPPHSIHITNALTSVSITYSMTPPSTPMCSVYRKHSKPIPRSLLHLTDPSLLLLEPTAGPAIYLMASVLRQTMDPFSAICRHPSVLKHSILVPS